MNSMGLRTGVILVIHGQSQSHVQEALRSVAMQESPWHELVIVGGPGSVRACQDLVSEELRGVDDRVVYVEQANRGPSAARNAGLHRSEADFVTFLDGDDAFTPDKLHRQAPLLASLPESYAAVSGGVEYVFTGRSNRRQRVMPPSLERDVYSRLAAGDINLVGNPGVHLFRRSPLEDVGGFNESLWYQEDTDLLVRIAKHFGIRAHPDVVLLKREHPGSLSDLSPEEHLRQALRFVQTLETTDPALPQRVFAQRRQRIHFGTARRYFLEGMYAAFVDHVKAGIGYGWPQSLRGWGAVLLAYSGLLGRWIAQLCWRAARRTGRPSSTTERVSEFALLGRQRDEGRHG